MVENIAHKVSPDTARTVLEQARAAWEGRHDFRRRRARSIMYEAGDQWGDMIEDPITGERMTEKEYITESGRVPVVNNLLGTMLRNLRGQFRQSQPDPIVNARAREKATAGEMMTNGLRYSLDMNEAEELDVKEFHEFLLSGASAYKVKYEWIPNLNRDDVTLDPVHQTRFFYNLDVKDPRLKDMWLCGEILDMDIDTLVSTYAKSRRDASRIREMYPYTEGKDRIDYNLILGEDSYNMIDFLVPVDQTLCRVIEVWRVEHQWQNFSHDPASGDYKVVTDEEIQQIALVNEARLITATQQGVQPDAVPLIDVQERYEPVWMCYHVTPNAEVLWASQTPYLHEQHPYEIILYPLTDGKVKGLVETVIDQQRYINRMMIMMDFALGHAAKGVLMVPEDVVPLGEDGEPDRQMFGDQWASFNGVVYYKPQPHQQLPKQITAESRVAGAEHLLQLQMNLLKEISGVTDATQGLAPGAGTPAALYAQQTVNAAMTTKDFFDSFFAFLKRRNKKVVKTILQFYDEPRYVRIDGGSPTGIDIYDPETVEGLDFDVALGQGTNSVLYRQMVDEYLMQFLTGGHIDFMTFLEMTSLPYADRLKALIQQKQAQIEAQAGQMQAAGLLSPQPTGGSPMPQQPVAPQAEPLRSRKLENANQTQRAVA